MINMMLFNPENPVILAIYRQGVFSLRRSEFGVGRWAFKGGGVKRRPDEQTLVPPVDPRLATRDLRCRECGHPRPSVGRFSRNRRLASKQTSRVECRGSRVNVHENVYDPDSDPDSDTDLDETLKP